MGEALTDRERGDLDAVVHAELLEEPGDVVLDGAGAHIEPSGDFGVVTAVADEAEHLALARRELWSLRLLGLGAGRTGVVGPHRVQEVTGDSSRDRRMPRRRRADPAHDV